MVSSGLSISSVVASERSKPQDAVLALQEDDAAAFVVADGAGGLGGGERAAGLVVQAFEDAIRNLGFPAVTGDANHWCDFLRELDGRLLEDRDAGESTAVVASIRAGRVVGASVGDSEAWIVTGEDVVVLTSPERTRARLGTGRAKPYAFDRSAAGSLILAASDGLFRAAAKDAICAVLRTAPSPEKLVSLARGRSGRLYDDVGLVLVKVAAT